MSNCQVSPAGPGVDRLMEELERLEYLSLVSRVCTELENHFDVNDKVLGIDRYCCTLVTNLVFSRVYYLDLR